MLEGGAPNIERQVEAQRRRLHKPDYLGDDLLKHRVAADEIRQRESILQISSQQIRVVSKQNGANAEVALRHQDGTQGALAHSEANVRARASGAVSGRRHSQYLVRRFIEAPAGIVSGVIDCFGHGAAFAERVSRPVVAMRRGVFFWCTSEEHNV